MKGLLLKDYYMIKKYCRSYIFILIIFLAISYFIESNPFFILYPTLIAGLIPVTLISYDEREKWDIYCNTLPYNKNQIVSGKYLIGFLLQFLVAIISSVAQGIKMISLGTFIWNDFLLLSGTIFVVGLIGPSFLLPFIFKLGAEKGRIAYYIIIGFIFIFITLISEKVFDLANTLTPKNYLIIVIITSFSLYFISWFISIKLYKTRETA
jgi:hypothetical protein